MYDVRSLSTIEKLERMGSNHRHTEYKPAALPPTELRSRSTTRCAFLVDFRKPPAFMPLASIVLYNDISDINDIFYLILHFFKYVSLM